MSEDILRKIKATVIFLMSALVMVLGYSKGGDNIRSSNRNVSSDKKNASQEVTHPITIEGDMPEISSGTQ